MTEATLEQKLLEFAEKGKIILKSVLERKVTDECLVGDQTCDVRMKIKGASSEIGAKVGGQTIAVPRSVFTLLQRKGAFKDLKKVGVQITYTFYRIKAKDRRTLEQELKNSNKSTQEIRKTAWLEVHKKELIASAKIAGKIMGLYYTIWKQGREQLLKQAKEGIEIYDECDNVEAFFARNERPRTLKEVLERRSLTAPASEDEIASIIGESGILPVFEPKLYDHLKNLMDSRDKDEEKLRNVKSLFYLLKNRNEKEFYELGATLREEFPDPNRREDEGYYSSIMAYFYHLLNQEELDSLKYSIFNRIFRSIWNEELKEQVKKYWGGESEEPMSPEELDEFEQAMDEIAEDLTNEEEEGIDKAIEKDLEKQKKASKPKKAKKSGKGRKPK